MLRGYSTAFTGHDVPDDDGARHGKNDVTNVEYHGAILHDSFHEDVQVQQEECVGWSDTIDELDPSQVWRGDVQDAFMAAISLYPDMGHHKICSMDGSRYGRNELIARYIFQKTGKIRTRKQVSSHLQVTRKKGQVGVKLSPAPSSVFSDPRYHGEQQVCTEEPDMVRSRLDSVNVIPPVRAADIPATDVPIAASNTFSNPFHRSVHREWLSTSSLPRRPAFHPYSRRIQPSFAANSSCAPLLRRDSAVEITLASASTLGIAQSSNGSSNSIARSDVCETVHLEQKLQQGAPEDLQTSSELPDITLPLERPCPPLFEPAFLVRAGPGSKHARLAYAALPFKHLSSGDDATSTCELLSLYEVNAPRALNIMTTVFSFGHPILKYCQRFNSVHDTILGRHLVQVENHALNAFLETFCQQIGDMETEPHVRKALLQNMVVTQTVGDEKQAYLDLTVTFRSVRRQASLARA